MSLAIMAVLYPIIFIGGLPSKTMAASLRKQARSPAAPCQLSVLRNSCTCPPQGLRSRGVY